MLPTMSSTKVSSEQMLAAACPTCGSKAGQKCELSIGQLRNTPHQARRLMAADDKLRDRLMAGLSVVETRRASR